MEKKYLRVTIYDNDFATTLKQVCELLYETFQRENRYPDETDLSCLKIAIQYMWCGANLAKNIMRWGGLHDSRFRYFRFDLSVVNEKEIPDWDNFEVAYIPLFDDGVIYY